jgi:hypothetical protein
MHRFPISQSPLMTRHLIDETEIFRKDPFVFAGIGLQGWHPAAWDVLAPCSRLHAFEVGEATPETLQSRGVGVIDFLKMDDGAASLEAGAKAGFGLITSQLLGLETALAFDPDLSSVSAYDSVESALAAHDLRLYNLQFGHETRRALPHPSSRDPYPYEDDRFFGYSDIGQIRRGVGLYFLDLLLPGRAARLASLPTARLLKLCALYEIYSLSDCAAELIQATRPHLEGRVRCDHLLDLLASGMLGRPINASTYLAAFQKDPTLQTLIEGRTKLHRKVRATARFGVRFAHRALLRLMMRAS